LLAAILSDMERRATMGRAGHNWQMENVAARLPKSEGTARAKATRYELQGAVEGLAISWIAAMGRRLILRTAADSLDFVRVVLYNKIR